METRRTYKQGYKDGMNKGVIYTCIGWIALIISTILICG